MRSDTDCHPLTEPVLAREFWQSLASKTGMRPRVTQKIWRRLRARPEMQAWESAFTQALTPGPWTMAEVFTTGPVRLQVVLQVVEDMVRDRQLSRRQGMQVQGQLSRLLIAPVRTPPS
jgi:hypothetical protein